MIIIKEQFTIPLRMLRRHILDDVPLPWALHLTIDRIEHVFNENHGASIESVMEILEEDT